MKMFILTSISISTSYLLASHPVILMALILAQALLICLVVWVNFKASWFSYILFLIFLGGLMVLFIYIVSLASNELIFNNTMNLFSFTAAAIFMALVVIKNFNSQDLVGQSSTFFKMKLFNTMYSWNNFSLLLAAMIYLLLTLIIVVKISNKFEAPLKNMTF